MLALFLQHLRCKQGLGNLCSLPRAWAWWAVRLEFDLSLWLSEQIGIYTRSSRLNSGIDSGLGPGRSSRPRAYVEQCLRYSLAHFKTQFTRWKKANIGYLVTCTASQIINSITCIFREIFFSNRSMIKGVWCSLKCVRTLVRGINPSQSRHTKPAFRFLCTIFSSS